jgi:hypothetical protein
VESLFDCHQGDGFLDIKPSTVILSAAQLKKLEGIHRECIGEWR